LSKVESILPFSSDQFIYPTSDPNGTSSKPSFHCMPSIMREVQILRESGLFPYNTVSDVLRHALHAHVAWLHKMKPQLNKERLMMIANCVTIIQDEMAHQAFAGMIDKLTQAVGTYRASGQEHLAKKLVLTILDNLEKGEGDNPHSKFYHKKIFKEHEDLLKGRKVKLF